ncbi:MAG: hypothetical protein ACRC2K_01590 [Clostridium sp.]
MEHILRKPWNIINKIVAFLGEKEEENPSFDISIPNNVLHRTELICKFISSEKGYDFEIENFLMLLYLDFIKNSIKSYNPKKIYTQLTTKYYENRTIILESGDECFQVNIKDTSFSTLEISMDREDVSKGQLILDELYDLYNIRISFNRLLEALWIGFIEGYKRGDNNKAFKTIASLLENCFK